MTEARRRRARNRRVAVAGAVAVVGTAAGLLVSSALASGAAGFVMTAATGSPVTSILTVRGTVQPASEVTAAFQVAGTVSAVDVSMGQQVTAGQKLATLDPTNMQMTVNTDQANLTAAQAKLTADENNQSSSGSSGAGGSAGTGAQTSAFTAGAARDAVLTSFSAAGGSGTGGSGVTALSKDQQAVVSGQHAVDLDLQTAAADLSSVQTSCTGGSGSSGTGNGTGSGGTPPTTSPPTTSPTTTADTTVPNTTVPGGSGSGATDGACATALAQAEQAEAKVADDQNSLAAAEAALAKDLSTAAASAGSGSASHAGSTSSGSTGSAAPAASTDTPERLAADTATIDSDEATLVAAQHNLDDTTLTAPISGTVAAVSLTAGQTVGARSTSYAVTIVNAGSYIAQATLTTAQVSEVSNGDGAQVTVDGTPGSTDGKVTRVGPVESSNSQYTYPVVIALDGTAAQFPAGADAQIQIDRQSVQNAVVVPTSAVHSNGTQSYVYLDKGGAEQERRVTVGVIGSVYTQILSGLSKGDQVVLADPSQKVPSSSTNATNTGLLGGSGINIRNFTGVGRFGGFGGGGAGFGGGGGAGTAGAKGG